MTLQHSATRCNIQQHTIFSNGTVSRWLFASSGHRFLVAISKTFPANVSRWLFASSGKKFLATCTHIYTHTRIYTSSWVSWCVCVCVCVCGLHIHWRGREIYLWRPISGSQTHINVVVNFLVCVCVCGLHIHLWGREIHLRQPISGSHTHTHTHTNTYTRCPR